jgi:hypothetical protein
MRRTSPKPDFFVDWREEQYWHDAQRIAYALGAAVISRDGSTWLVTDEGERLVCAPERPKRIWFETWKALRTQFTKDSKRSTGERALLRAYLATFRARSYGDLVTLMDTPHVAEERDASGTTYQLQASVFWDDEPGGNIRVLASLSGGGWRDFLPLCEDFIMAPDGTFVGE